MRRRTGRQSWRRTNRELHYLLSRAGRKWIKEVWRASDEIARRNPPLSPLAAAVGAGIAQSGGGSDASDAEAVRQARSTVMRIGYATRIALAVPTDQPSLDQTWFGLSPGLGPEALDAETDEPAPVRELVDTVRSRATTDFASAMTLPEEVWAAYTVAATRELQQTLAGDSVSWQELSRQRIDELLRCGYLLRCLEEALEHQPALSDD